MGMFQFNFININYVFTLEYIILKIYNSKTKHIILYQTHNIKVSNTIHIKIVYIILSNIDRI